MYKVKHALLRGIHNQTLTRLAHSYTKSLSNEFLEVKNVSGRGRAVIAKTNIFVGDTILTCRPLAKVRKKSISQAQLNEPNFCRHCFSLIDDDRQSRYCSENCNTRSFVEGEEILSRCDDTALRQISTDDGRNFPLLTARIVARILSEFKHNEGISQTATHVAHLCFAKFADEIKYELQKDYTVIKDMFTTASIIKSDDFELIFPKEWYFRAIGSLQINAFELYSQTTFNDRVHSVTSSALLPLPASLFNHSCLPVLEVSTTASTETSFKAIHNISRGDELTISYLPSSSKNQIVENTAKDTNEITPTLQSSKIQRQEFLQDKYGFKCLCDKCRL